MPRDPNKRMIGLWVREELKTELQNLALEQNRTVSNYIETVLLDYMQKRKQTGRTKTVQPPEIM